MAACIIDGGGNHSNKPGVFRNFCFIAISTGIPPYPSIAASHLFLPHTDNTDAKLRLSVICFFTWLGFLSPWERKQNMAETKWPKAVVLTAVSFLPHKFKKNFIDKNMQNIKSCVKHTNSPQFPRNATISYQIGAGVEIVHQTFTKTQRTSVEDQICIKYPSYRTE